VTDIDVVIVSFNSSEHLRGAVLPLLDTEGLRVIVVDNASTDGSLDRLADLDITTIRQPVNGGFAAGCNAGWRAGEAENVLFLNPDARIGSAAARLLADVLHANQQIGAVGPLILESDGGLAHSIRRFPSLVTSYAEALFLHRLAPASRWSGELVLDARAYVNPGTVDWLSGACLLVRRAVLASLGGWDEGFFLYAEDRDLCRRIWNAGFEVYFEPRAIANHAGGASRDQRSLLPLLAASRIRYAAQHRSRLGALVERAGVALCALTHVFVSRGGWKSSHGHVQALAVAMLPDPTERALRYAGIRPRPNSAEQP
jgi:GT2 family glycosyltransferase